MKQTVSPSKKRKKERDRYLRGRFRVPEKKKGDDTGQGITRKSE